MPHAPENPAAAAQRREDPVEVVLDVLALRQDADRARALTGLLLDAQMLLAFLSAQRDDAVRAVCAGGASYSDIAALLGVSKSRAQQICRRLVRDAGETPSP